VKIARSEECHVQHHDILKAITIDIEMGDGQWCPPRS